MGIEWRDSAFDEYQATLCKGLIVLIAFKGRSDKWPDYYYEIHGATLRQSKEKWKTMKDAMAAAEREARRLLKDAMRNLRNEP